MVAEPEGACKGMWMVPVLVIGSEGGGGAAWSPHRPGTRIVRRSKAQSILVSSIFLFARARSSSSKSGRLNDGMVGFPRPF